MTLKRTYCFLENKVEVRTVLNDIDLVINKGETVALIGTNGSGKVLFKIND